MTKSFTDTESSTSGSLSSWKSVANCLTRTSLHILQPLAHTKRVLQNSRTTLDIIICRQGCSMALFLIYAFIRMINGAHFSKIISCKKINFNY